MANVTSFVNDYYQYINEDLADVRVRNYMFMSSPLYLVGIIVAYLYFVQEVGPRLMKNRKPFNLEKAMIIYNASQVALNVWFAERALTLGWWNGMKFICEPVDISTSPKAMLITRIVWGYFILKVLDMLDTVFIILRKKASQVTFLHVYHHTGMVVATWIATKYVPGGHGTFLGLINSIVHSIMYSYYLLACINKDYKDKLWWKKYLTLLQMIQFLILFLHTLSIFLKRNCEYPTMPIAIMLPQYIVILILFVKFYRNAYMKKEKEV